jgi:Flp pilus assembly protein TadB
MTAPSDQDGGVPEFPDPPQTRALYMSATLFAGLGFLHLILSALVECLQALNFWLGLFEIVVAFLLFWFTVKRARRRPRAAMLEDAARRPPR